MSDVLGDTQADEAGLGSNSEIMNQREDSQSKSDAYPRCSIAINSQTPRTRIAVAYAETQKILPRFSPNTTQNTLNVDDADASAAFLSPAATLNSLPSLSPILSPTSSAVPSKKRSAREDTDCVICLSLMINPHLTPCGHTFCLECISKHLESKQSCPLCSKQLTNDHLFPNIQLNNLVKKIHSSIKVQKHSPIMKELCSSLGDRRPSGKSLDSLLAVLAQKKAVTEIQDSVSQAYFLLHFLEFAKTNKLKEFAELQAQINELQRDITTLDSMRPDRLCDERRAPDLHSASYLRSYEPPRFYQDASQTPSCALSKSSPLSDAVAKRRERLEPHFEELVQTYTSSRTSDCDQNIAGISTVIDDLTRFSQLKSVSSIRNTESAGTSCIVSSIEFDRDEQFFAAAGTNKKIKIYDVEEILKDPLSAHLPVKEISWRYKISCLSYNPNTKGNICSSDYDGSVVYWDCERGVPIRQYKEHEKRVWSINFSRAQQGLLASGSDDCKVKIWSLHQEQSVLTIEAKANVCCVEFNPESPYTLAFGSADHQIQYYDIRQPRDVLASYQQHRKAVSYVKFLSQNEIVSASTDCTLRSWDLTKRECVRSYSGHVNEKNFVGLSTSGGYIACGSEDNSVYFFHKSSPKSVLVHRFGSSISGHDEVDDEANLFVSSVRMRTKSHHMLAANSQGTIKLLQYS